jgi:hypothetical protein
MRFAAAIIVYQDRDGLKRLCDSIHQGFDFMFIEDGKFPNHPGESALSTDGTREVALSYPNAVLFDCPWAEYEKRQYYLKLCQDYGVDYLCILDSDEYAEKSDAESWQKFRQNMYDIVQNTYHAEHHVFSIYIQVAARYYDNQVRHTDVWLKEDDIQYGHYPRIWYQPYAIEYHKGTHHLYRMRDPRHKDHNVHQLTTMHIIDTIKFRHDHVLRTPEHQERRRIYQSWLVPYEGDLQKRWALIEAEARAKR